MLDDMSGKNGRFLLLGAAGCGALWITAALGPSLESPRELAPLVPQTTENAAYSDTPATLAEQRALRARLGQLEQQISKLSEREAAAASAATEPVTPQPSARDVAQSELRQRVDVVRRLEQEPVDAAWQAKTEVKLAQALSASPEPDVVLLGSACRSSHCSVQLDLEAVAPEERPLAINRMLAAVPWETQAFYQPLGAEDSARGAMYISREGRNAFASLK